MPRHQYYLFPNDKFEYDARSTRRSRPTAWAHNSQQSPTRLVDADGEHVQGGDGVRRHSLVHPVLVGTPAGRPENAYEALMQCGPGQEPLADSEALDASQGRVDALLAMLPLPQRQVAVLIVGEGLSVREAAERLSVGKSQVDRRWQAAKRQLAALLGAPEMTNETVDGLAEMALELGEYLQLAPSKNDDDEPEVTQDEWDAYQVALQAPSQRQGHEARLRPCEGH